MKTFLYYICFLIVGFIIGYFVGCSNNSKLDIITAEKIETKIDTVEKIVNVKIPVPITKYIYQTDSITNYCIDSFFVDVIHRIENEDSIPVNVYQDSISDPDYKLKYNIETIGFLNSFKYDLNVYSKTELVTRTKLKKPNWMISGAVSNELNWKIGAGFKGWTIEGEFDRNFNQLFIGKQFTF